jgi:arginine deiminase
MKLKLNTEFGTLTKVIMHRPGSEIERLLPKNTSELLFEDVPFLETMQHEHDEYTRLIKNATDAKVYRLRQLLQDILIDQNLKKSLLEKALGQAGHTELSEEIISYYSTAEIINILISGIRVDEIKWKYAGFRSKKLKENDYLIYPSPNLYFMRDPAAIIQEGVISGNMKFSGRQFESHLIKLVFTHHPEFREHYREVFPADIISDNCPTIEGGDVMVLSPKVLVIGCSERTQSEAIQLVAKKVLVNGTIERVYEVRLPSKRNYMHLDTVFSIIDENLVLAYREAMDTLKETFLYQLTSVGENNTVNLKRESIKKSLISILQSEVSHLEVVDTGYGHPDYASREQWYDGANVFAIGPRRVISYNRNKLTNRALRDKGVEVLEINSSELSRGLGGPRCMTMPIERKNVYRR